MIFYYVGVVVAFIVIYSTTDMSDFSDLAIAFLVSLMFPVLLPIAFYYSIKMAAK